MKPTNFPFILLVLLFILITSCASRRDIVYLQNVDAVHNQVQSYANVLEPDDNLLITVTAAEPELAAPFNLMFLASQSNATNNLNNENLISYLVDSDGNIDFPVLGTIKLGGLTRVESENKIKELLKPHLINPGVNLRVLNFKVSVLGEVNRPGLQQVVGDRITLLEALSSAGDLTILGKRNDIIVLREQEGSRVVGQVDITSADFIKSPYYYLAHNDVIYVKPNQTRINSSVIGPNLSIAISALSVLVTIIALSTR